MIGSYIEHFPVGYVPTGEQVKIINGIEKAFNSKKKFVICCAPTGSGKSFVAKTLQGLSKPPTEEFRRLITSYDAYKKEFDGGYTYSAECLEEPSFGSFVLTITKTLQDQYQQLFDDITVLKGKTNYRCDIDDNFDTELAPCTFVPRIKDQCWSENRCPYYNARNDVLTSTLAALNYKMFFSLPDHVKKKNFIVCDEASELEDEIIRHFSAEVIYEKLDNYDIPYKTLITDNNQRALNWITELVTNILDVLNDLTSKATSKTRPVSLSQSEQIKYTYLKNLHRSLTSLISLWSKGEYIIEVDAKRVLITPLKADFLSDSLFSYGEKVVLLSATIIDHKNFARSLGIKDYEYIEVGSNFDPKKSPIYVSSKYKLNYKTLKSALPGICQQIDQILDHHKEDKGIIHTHTFEITEFIRSKVNSNRLLIRSTNATNEDILKKHMDDKNPTVLVSPSLTYGIDLADELARFQIIVKLPFPSLASKRVKQLFETDKDWYENKMLNAIVQASGRATRNKDDYSITYILDGNFVNVIAKSASKLPKHFIERIH